MLKKRKTYEFRGLSKEERNLVKVMYEEFYDDMLGTGKLTMSIGDMRDRDKWYVQVTIRRADFRDDETAMQIKDICERVFKRNCFLTID